MRLALAGVVVFCLAVVSIIFGIDGAVLRDGENRVACERTGQFSEAAQCELVRTTELMGADSDNKPCAYWRFDMTLMYEGIVVNVVSYSKLFPGCGGVALPDVFAGEHIPCWFKPSSIAPVANATPVLVRTIPATERDLAFLRYGIALIVLGGLPILLFFGYNIFLFVAIRCCGLHPVRRLPVTLFDVDQLLSQQRRNEPFNFEPREPNEIVQQVAAAGSSPSSSSWLHTATNNQYAQAILRQFVEERPMPNNPVQQHSTSSLGGLPPAMPVAYECPICYDTHMASAVLFPCGHYTCLPCAKRLLEQHRTHSTARNVDEFPTPFSSVDVVAPCPQCRAPIGRNDPVLIPIHRRENEDEIRDASVLRPPV